MRCSTVHPKETVKSPTLYCCLWNKEEEACKLISQKVTWSQDLLRHVACVHKCQMNMKVVAQPLHTSIIVDLQVLSTTRLQVLVHGVHCYYKCLRTQIRHIVLSAIGKILVPDTWAYKNTELATTASVYNKILTCFPEPLRLLKGWSTLGVSILTGRTWQEILLSRVLQLGKMNQNGLSCIWLTCMTWRRQ